MSRNWIVQKKISVSENWGREKRWGSENTGKERKDAYWTLLDHEGKLFT